MLNWWKNSKKEFKGIVKFHSEFEKIHPFQDGNGRVGRFIMLKQCIESSIGIVAIDEIYNIEYKKALFDSQMSGNYKKLENVFKICQKILLEERSELLKSTLNSMDLEDKINELVKDLSKDKQLKVKKIER